MNGSRIKLDKKEKTILFIIFIVHVALLYLISNYSKAMETYPDEIIYYDIAKSIFEGKSFELHGVNLQFSKLAYSFVLLPTFLIKNVVVRVRAIMLINSVLMSLSFIPCYMICKELGVNKYYSRLAAFLIFIWPDIIISGTFMSENLFFPVTAFAFYFILLSYKYKNRKYTIIVLALGLLSYFTKEIGICVLLAYIAAEVISAVLNKGSLKKIGLYILALAAVYIAVRMLFFGGFSNSYINSGALNPAQFFNYKSAMYLIYGLFYNIAAIILAFYVLPVLLPVINYKKLDDVTRKYLLYTILLLIGEILVITVTITAREDLGKAIPGIHLRYLAGIMVPLISIFFAYLSLDDTLEKKNLLTIVPVLVFVGCIFKGIINTCTTGTIGLLYIYPARKIITGIIHPAEAGILHSIVGIATTVGFAILIFIIFGAAKKSKDLAVYIFFYSAMLLSVVNMAYGAYIVHDTYEDDPEMIDEMVKIDRYFEENGLEDANVAFVDESQFSEVAKVYDLYFDSADKEYMIPKEDLENNDINSAALVEPIVSYTYRPEKIQYFIVSNEDELTQAIPEDMEQIPELSGEFYLVYKANDL
ncbi:hypothetical protein [Butyrivibrio sp. AD3002]|uniref:hypothetical protein n=1 Tax=Butyrivibrio sp. AD3002 TaxID=1280670 RepID=UPI0003B4FD88|nr:hypothetical protein [Butyrivibrio sp. AD3002]